MKGIRPQAAGEKILIVDDEREIREILGEFLQQKGYRTEEAGSAEAALGCLASDLPDLIILDVNMPGRTGLDLCRQLKADPRTQLLPVVLLTARGDLQSRVAGLEAGADDFFVKPWESAEIAARIRSLLRLKRVLDELDRAESVITGLGLAIESRDPYTAGHCARLAHAAVTLGERLGLDRSQLKALYLGGYLHDLGKVLVPDAVLRKPGPLNDEEWALMREHPAAGERICLPMKTLADVRPIIRHHHEKWDGSGYPDGLTGEAIPLLARIVAAADAYDALRTERSYKPPLSREETLKILREEGRRGRWDPTILANLVECVKRGLVE